MVIPSWMVENDVSFHLSRVSCLLGNGNGIPASGNRGKVQLPQQDIESETG
jgi:hypothetical protein